MTISITRRAALALGAASALALSAGAGLAETITLRMSTVATETDQRTVALAEVFGPAVAGFADYQPFYNGTLFKQATELEAIARGNLEMAITSAQELATFFPEFSVFTAGYLHRDAAHQVAVFNDPLMDPFKKKAEDELGVKLLTVMYLGRRQINLRTDQEVKTPADLAGVKLRMPGTDAWQFLGSALGRQPGADGLRRGLYRASDRRHRRPGQSLADGARFQVLRGHQADRADLASGGPQLSGAVEGGLGRDDAGTAGRHPEGRR